MSGTQVWMNCLLTLHHLVVITEVGMYDVQRLYVVYALEGASSNGNISKQYTSGAVSMKIHTPAFELALILCLEL